jgi:hypothetical protein
LTSFAYIHEYRNASTNTLTLQSVRTIKYGKHTN